MIHGMPALFARLWNFGQYLIEVDPGRPQWPHHQDQEELTEQQMRDIGILDGRPSRQRLPRCERREQWWAMERPPTL